MSAIFFFFFILHHPQNNFCLVGKTKTEKMPGRICGVSVYLESLGNGEGEEEGQEAPSDPPAEDDSTSSSPPPLEGENDGDPWMMVNGDGWISTVEASTTGGRDNHWGEHWDGEEEEEAWSDAQAPHNDDVNDDDDNDNNDQRTWAEWAADERKKEEEMAPLGGGRAEEKAWSDAEPPRDDPAYFQQRQDDQHAITDNANSGGETTTTAEPLVGDEFPNDENAANTAKQDKDEKNEEIRDNTKPNNGERKTCGEACPCSEELIAAVKRLYALKDKFERLLHAYPHYSSFIRDVCLESWAGDMDVLFGHLDEAEKARASKLACRECARLEK